MVDEVVVRAAFLVVRKTGAAHIDLPGGNGRQDHGKVLLDRLKLEAHGLGDGAGEVHLEAHDVAFGVLEFERREGRVGADGQGAVGVGDHRGDLGDRLDVDLLPAVGDGGLDVGHAPCQRESAQQNRG